MTIANTWAELGAVLRAREIDVFVTRLRSGLEEDLEQQALFDDPLVVITGRDNPRFRGRSVKLSQLLDEPWCVPHVTHTIGALIRQAFTAQGLALPSVCVTCVSMQLQMALAETGRFLTVVPASYLRFRSDKKSLRIVSVDLHVSPPPIGFVTLKNRAISPVTALFIKTLRAVARDGM